MDSQAEPARPATPDEVENRILWNRGRIGAVLILAGIAVFFVGELALRPLQRPAINAIQALNFVFVCICLWLGNDPQRRSFNCNLCFAGFASTAAAIGAIGIIAGDPTSTLVALNGLALGTAILLPWGERYQLAVVIFTIATAIWTYASTRAYSIESWIQPVSLVLPSLAAAVAVAYLVRRQRLMVADGERERIAREITLQKANDRLAAEVHEHEKTETALRLALLELDHRVKNTLTTLRSIAEQTLELSASPEHFAESIRGRIRAMANIHSGLAANRGEGLDLCALIDLVVGPYRINENSVSTSCERAALSADQVRTLGTALHELATNAAKYGALSTQNGHVEIHGAVSSDSKSGEPHLRLVWREQGGPQVSPPNRRGLGTKLISDALRYESGGEVQLHFDESGAWCEIDMPLESQGIAAG